MNCAILSGAKIIRDRPLLARLSRFADGCFLALSARTGRIGKVSTGSRAVESRGPRSLPHPLVRPRMLPYATSSLCTAVVEGAALSRIAGSMTGSRMSSRSSKA